MQLKQLDLHGFKTFASKTRFQFDDGITAIVGPNGSGKSNLADAVRWILGEQRNSMLRARKNDDLIFSGTEKRTRMGMAHGAITLDNRAGTLPIDFAEVVVGRRIFRNGDSEYLINGNRVRLRDVQELLGHASIGTTTYTVIGQGLVDAALALRPAERRQLFEDAAGLGAYQGRRDDALRRLAKTEEHLTRVSDILAEVTPQMRRLKRQAERAEEYLSIKNELVDALQQLYGYRWGAGGRALSLAREQLARHRETLTAASTAVAEVEDQLDELRERQQTLRQQIDAARHERGQLRQQAEAVRREQAVAEERTRGYQRQMAALQQEQSALETELATLDSQFQAGEASGAALREKRAAAQQSLNERKAALAEAEAEQESLRSSLREARRTVGRLTARAGELAQQQNSLGSRQQALTQERTVHQEALALLADQQAQHERELALLAEELATLNEQHRTLTGEQERLATAEREAAASLDEARRQQHEVERQLTALTTRQELLARLRKEGAGYEAGVRALLKAGKRLAPDISPVADMLRVPAEIATAISAALGSQLQGVALGDDGEAARDWLHQQQTGRVTLLPLGALAETSAARLPAHVGVVGRAADLVAADDPTLLEYLLGDWLVVEDWATVKALGNTGWHLVTRDGQVRTRRGAIVAGNGEGKGSTLLAQSREWAALPAQIEAAEGQRTAASEALAQATERVAQIEQQRRRLADSRRQIEQQQRRVQERQASEQRDSGKVQQESQWRSGLVEKVEAEQRSLAEQATTLSAATAALIDEQAEADAAVTLWEQRVEAAQPGALREAVERARTQVAIADEQLASWQRSQRTLQDEQARLQERHGQKVAQVSALSEEASGIDDRLATLVATLDEAEQALSQSRDSSRPLEAEQAQNVERLATLEAQHLSLRKQRQLREDEAHTAQLALQSAEERMRHLAQQIENDLGVIGDAGEEESGPTTEELIAALPRVEALDMDVEERARQLRRRLGRLGAINPDAPAEFVEVEARHRFLTEQSEDLTKAMRDLRQIVGELDRLMEARFIETFEQIGEAFRHYFNRLFKGGQAQLELTEPEDITNSGIEIVARPPGKRAQSIALLSGGERALTAA
ncbi:MAG: chromosome segregation protein SMC, partial [Anaerolineales bacterium]|nr:chromosome segregation protein SMC [Anaerolineales bacterium]